MPPVNLEERIRELWAQVIATKATDELNSLLMELRVTLHEHSIRDFDPQKFLPTIGKDRRSVYVRKKQTIYARGAACDAVFYVQKGKVKLNLVSKNGKEVTVAILNPGDFFGEGGLAGQPLRIDSATAMTDCELMRIENSAMRLALHQERAFSDMFVAYLVRRNLQYEANLVTQIFNSSE